MYKIRKNSCTQKPTQWLPLASGNCKRDLGEGGGEKVLFLDLGPGSKCMKIRSAVRWLLVNFPLCVYFDNKEIKWVKKLCFWNCDKQNIVFSYDNGARLRLLPCSVRIPFNRGCSKQEDKAREILSVSQSKFAWLAQSVQNHTSRGLNNNYTDQALLLSTLPLEADTAKWSPEAAAEGCFNVSNSYNTLRDLIPSILGVFGG